MKKTLLFAAVVAMASSCGNSMPVKKTGGDSAAKRCPASQPRDINMWINAMPGVDSGERPPLLVNFIATTPTPGYQFALKLNRVMESFPEQVVLDLMVTAPDGIVPQVLKANTVSLKLPDFPGSEGSSVQVNCEGKPFFSVAKVTAAH